MVTKYTLFNVETSQNGTDALKMFCKRQFNVVITDHLMPGIDGNSLACLMRKSAKGDIFIIGVSGTPHCIDKNNFNLVLAKPFSLKALVEAVKDGQRPLSTSCSAPYHPLLHTGQTMVQPCRQPIRCCSRAVVYAGGAAAVMAAFAAAPVIPLIMGSLAAAAVMAISVLHGMMGRSVTAPFPGIAV